VPLWPTGASVMTTTPCGFVAAFATVCAAVLSEALAAPSQAETVPQTRGEVLYIVASQKRLT